MANRWKETPTREAFPRMEDSDMYFTLCRTSHSSDLYRQHTIAGLWVWACRRCGQSLDQRLRED